MGRFALLTILTFYCSVTALLRLCYSFVPALLLVITAKLLLCNCSGVIVLLLLCYYFATATEFALVLVSAASLVLFCSCSR